MRNYFPSPPEILKLWKKYSIWSHRGVFITGGETKVIRGENEYQEATGGMVYKYGQNGLLE